MKVLLKRLCLMERLDIGDRPSPLWERRRGFAEHGSAPPQPAHDAARAVERVWKRGNPLYMRFAKFLRKQMARAFSLLWRPL